MAWSLPLRYLGPLCGGVLSWACFGGCTKDKAPAQPSAVTAQPSAVTAQPSAVTAQPSAVTAQPLPFPTPLAALATTSSTLALDNFEAQIQSAEKRLVERPADTAVMAALCDLYLAKGRYLGDVAQYDRASAMAERLVKTAPNLSTSYLVRAQVHSTFHLFQKAFADLAQAEKLKEPGTASLRFDSLRAALYHATGEREKAFALFETIAKVRPDLDSLGMLAAAYGERGDLAQAEKTFREALNKYTDVSPFPVAWLHLQAGLMWEEADRPAKAKEAYEIAVLRLPTYATAVSHLAALQAKTGDKESAVTALAALVKRSNGLASDPEYKGQLAELLVDPKAQAALRKEAAAAYERLLAKHPEAYANHAARFYLGASQPAKAHALALKNLALAKTPEAYLLVLETFAAIADPKGACELAASALPKDEGARVPPRLLVGVARAFAACGKADQADQLLRRLPPT